MRREARAQVDYRLAVFMQLGAFQKQVEAALHRTHGRDHALRIHVNAHESLYEGRGIPLKLRNTGSRRIDRSDSGIQGHLLHVHTEL